jgi:hypothetical protein
MPWQRRHPANIDRALWLYWLDQMPEPSPYLLPEWSLFWERVWPRSRAEIWLAGDLERADGGVPSIRRRRCGMEWLFSQPYGTTGGWIGPALGASAADSPLLLEASWEDLLPTIITHRTVEVTMTTQSFLGCPPGWRSQQLIHSSWILDRRGVDKPDILSEVSESHRRNIEKGSHAQPELIEMNDSQAVAEMQNRFPAALRRISRLALHPQRGPLLASALAPGGALRWLTARVRGVPVATTIWLAYKETAVYVDGALIRDEGAIGVNHYLFATLLTRLHNAGVRLFDFGAGPRGETSEGLARFKEGWGAQPVERIEICCRRPAYQWLRSLLP